VTTNSFAPSPRAEPAVDTAAATARSEPSFAAREPMPVQALGELRYLPSPIQRRPASGSAAAPPAPPSAKDLLDTIEYGYFTDSKKTVTSKNEKTLRATKAADTKVPKRIEVQTSEGRRGRDGFLPGDCARGRRLDQCRVANG
jgi:hypothetical protein